MAQIENVDVVADLSCEHCGYEWVVDLSCTNATFLPGILENQPCPNCEI